MDMWAAVVWELQSKAIFYSSTTEHIRFFLENVILGNQYLTYQSDLQIVIYHMTCIMYVDVNIGTRFFVSDRNF
jgi:hypothetical protein